MCDADIKSEVSWLQSWTVGPYRDCLLKAGLWQAAQGIYSALSSPVVPLILLVGLVCTFLGYTTFLVLLHQEKETVMQDAATRDIKTNGLLKKALSGPRKAFAELGKAQPPAPQQPTPQPLVIEYEQPVPENGLPTAQTVASSTPAPRTPSAFSQPPVKSPSDSEEGIFSRLDHAPSGLANAPQPQAGVSGDESFASLASKVEDRGPLTGEIADGNNNYVWDDDSEYFGEWESGRAHGRGVFSWPNSDRYEGEWRNGLENGVGTFIAADGTTFYGPWSNGKMHGQVMYQPAARPKETDMVYMREYRRGELIKETKLRGKDYDYLRKEVKKDQRSRRVEKRQAAKEMMTPPRPGETIYKGHRSYNLMRSLQQGISFSVASIDKQVGARDAAVKPSDFKKEIVQHMPSSGEFPPFKWKDYSPYVFHCLREAFGIDNRDYLISITNRNTLRELPSPGKSGSVFFISDDERFMIKTVRKEEMHLLIDLIPKYYNHCVENPDTLLTRFYGVHRIKPISGPQVRFVVMGNVFPTETKMDRRFDLKGSSHGRTAGSKKNSPNVILKDLDVDFRLQLKDELYNKLMRQIKADAALLERMRVMDYSLLLGIHYLEDPDAGADPLEQRSSLATEAGDSPTKGSDQQVPWSREFAVAESDANKFSTQEPIFMTWRSQRHLEVDEPSPPRLSSATSNRGGQAETVGADKADSRDTATTDVSSLTSASLLSTINSYASQAGLTDGGDLRAAGFQQAPSVGSASPHKLSRFGLESHGESVRLPHTRSSPQAEETGKNLGQGSTPETLRMDDPEAVAQQPPQPQRSAFDSTATTRETSARDMKTTVPQFLQLINRLSSRNHELKGAPSGLERTRSGWIKAQEEGTSLRSLHISQTPHMGVSIPAVAYPLRLDGTADTSTKPQPVTLFFGIIDFLQLYNLRKWSEHQLKSIVQDSKAISVTNPKAYSRRFLGHMQTLFIPIPGQQ